MEGPDSSGANASDPVCGRIRVAVWSPFAPLARELRALLDRARDLVVVDLKDHESAAQAARVSSADVLVADVDAAPSGAGALVADAGRSNPRGRILALSAHVDRRLAAGVLRAGASGYLLKGRAFEELTDAVRAVARGERYVSQLDETAPHRRRDGGFREAPNQVQPDGSGRDREA
jgi:DNA-binding NarL/FixJ family response regulator